MLLDVTDKRLLYEYYAKTVDAWQDCRHPGLSGRSSYSFRRPTSAAGLGDAIERVWQRSLDWLAALLPELTTRCR